MSTHILLYGRPLGTDPTVAPLSLVGNFPDYVYGQNYEGRIDIVGAIGRCRVDIIEATLPPGARVFADNFNHQVVVKWDAFNNALPTSTTVPNGDFEAGDDEWILGEGWTITSEPAGDAYAGTKSAQYLATGSSWCYGRLVPAEAGDVITLTGQVQQGASSKNNAGGAVGLSWYNAQRKRIHQDKGNEVNSGSDSEWHASTVTAGGPVGTAYVSADIFGWRRKQWKPLWIDALTWDHSYAAGQEEDLEAYPLTLMVTDAAGRTAIWSGVINAGYIYRTSLLYPFDTGVEAVTSTMLVTGALLRDVQRTYTADVESIKSTLVVTNATLATPLQTSNVTETIKSTLAVTGALLRTTLQSTSPVESIKSTLTVTGGTLAVKLVTTNQTESVKSSLVVTGATLT